MCIFFLCLLPERSKVTEDFFRGFGFFVFFFWLFGLVLFRFSEVKITIY